MFIPKSVVYVTRAAFLAAPVLTDVKLDGDCVVDSRFAEPYEPLDSMPSYQQDEKQSGCWLLPHTRKNKLLMRMTRRSFFGRVVDPECFWERRPNRRGKLAFYILSFSYWYPNFPLVRSFSLVRFETWSTPYVNKSCNESEWIPFLSQTLIDMKHAKRTFCLLSSTLTSSFLRRKELKTLKALIRPFFQRSLKSFAIFSASQILSINHKSNKVNRSYCISKFSLKELAGVYWNSKGKRTVAKQKSCFANKLQPYYNVKNSPFHLSTKKYFEHKV